MRIKPFRALMPVADAAERVAAPPYDTMDRDEALAMVAGNPDHFLHVSRAEVDLSPDIPPYDDRVYASARDRLKDFEHRGVMIRDDRSCLYLYRQCMGRHEQTGIVACSHIDDYTNNRILRHEKTRREKEDDRTRYVLKLRAHIGPVFLTYRDVTEIDQTVAATQSDAPLFDFVASDKIRHTVWRVRERNTERLRHALNEVPCAYVADGHHRAAAAVRAGRLLREADGHRPEEAEYDWFLSVFFPSSQLNVLPYHRCVTDLNGLSPERFLNKIAKTFTVEAAASASLSGERQCGMYLNGRWYRLAWQVRDKGLPAGETLDVSFLQNKLLSPVLGIEDPRNDPRVFFVGGVRGTAELERLVDSGKARVAFAMWPVSVARVMDIADAGLEMPPKSTWFEPKIRSGLLVHTF